MADYSDAFAETEQKYGLPPGYLARTYQLEGTTKNPRSSADGPFQFIDSTARAYGLKDKHNLAEATDAAARLARDNAAALRSALGRDPTAAELYLAHQQGSGGAIKMLSNPNATVGGDAIANNGGQPGMTGGAFANKWTSKFDGSPSLPPMLQPPQQSAAPSMAQSYAPQDEQQQGGLGGFFNDPQKLVALAALAKVFDPWGKDQTPAMLQAMQLKQHGQEKKAQQDALVLALTRSGMDEQTARALAANPAAAQMGLTQQTTEAGHAADRAATSAISSYRTQQPAAPVAAPQAAPEAPAPFPAPLPGMQPGPSIPQLPPQQPGPMSLAQYGDQMMSAQADEAQAPATSTPTSGGKSAPEPTQYSRPPPEYYEKVLERRGLTDKTITYLRSEQQKAMDERNSVTSGFERTSAGLRPIPGGPASPEYLAEKARKEVDPNAIKPLGKGAELYKTDGNGNVTIVHKNQDPISADAASIDDKTATLLANRVLQGDTKALAGLGRGAQGAANILKIHKFASDIADENGIDARAILNNTAQQAGLVSASRALGTKETHFGVAEKAMEESLPLAQAASDNVPRTEWLTVNKLIQAGQTEHANPKLKRFLIATDTAAKDYARTINPTGALRESDIEYARKILSTADGPEAYTAALDQLRMEAGVMHRAIQRQKTELRGGDKPKIPDSGMAPGNTGWKVISP